MVNIQATFLQKSARSTLPIFAILLSVPACDAQSGTRTSSVPEPSIKIGEDLKICADCPAFVRVPDAPAPMRSIRFVSKFELTWRNYLAAHDDGSCKIPRYANMAGEYDLKAISANVDLFRVDWPATQLGPAEVACYIDWLQKKTGYVVALPTGAEWEWFARAGREGAKYPWGNSPTASDEALFGVDDMFNRLPEGPVPRNRGGEYVDGLKVGQSSPNLWGLYDIMGNVMELTADTISGEEWLQLKPNSAAIGKARSFPRVLVKGSDARNKDWSGVSISDKHYSVIIGSRYTVRVGTRLILLKRSK